jgi:hypothetical protein
MKKLFALAAGAPVLAAAAVVEKTCKKRKKTFLYEKKLFNCSNSTILNASAEMLKWEKLFFFVCVAIVESMLEI